jgi:nucleotide-binding universal stress UspA family protein
MNAMNMTVVVPVDTEGLADGAMRFLQARAACGPLETHFVYILPDLTGAGPQQALAQTGTAVTLRNQLRDALRAAGFEARVEFRMGDAAHEIAKMALTENADLIVMPTHGRTGLDRLLHGSVAESVLRLSPVPVLIANERERSRSGRDSATLRRIMWAVHDPALDDELHALVAATARIFNAEVLIYHNDTGLDDLGEPTPGAASASWTDARHKRLQRDGVLTRILAVSSTNATGDARRAAPDHQGARLPLRAPNVAEDIVRQVNELDVGLLVMGTHGRGGLVRGLFGSVAEEVVRHCPCPVLLKRPARKDPRLVAGDPFTPG